MGGKKKKKINRRLFNHREHPPSSLRDYVGQAKNAEKIKKRIIRYWLTRIKAIKNLFYMLKQVQDLVELQPQINTSYFWHWFTKMNTDLLIKEVKISVPVALW